MRLRLLFGAALLTGLVCWPATPAKAKIIYAGNTNASDVVGGPGGFQGTFNAAVYDLTGGSAGDSYGTGITGMDGLIGGANQPYLYLYSIANTGNSPKAIFRGTVDISADSVVSADTFVTSLHFVDNDGAVTAAADNDLGYDARVFTDNAPFDAMSSGDLGSVGLAFGTGLKMPWLTLTSHTFGMFVYPALAPGETTAIAGFKAGAHSLRVAGIIDGAVASGHVPSTVPEPGTALALLSMVPILGLFWHRRRRN